MTYRLLRRSRDKQVGVVHLKDPMGTQLSLCGQGFASMTLDMDIKHTAVPTCVFCIAGVVSGLQHWKLQAYDNVMRQTIENGLETIRDVPPGTEED
jgi:hypothetical protein